MGERVKLRREDLDWREVEGELIALDLRGSNYLAINSSGVTLWPVLVRGATVDELRSALMDQYGIDEQTAARDVDAFLEMLRSHRLLDD